MPSADLWELFCDYLYFCNKVYNFQIHNFVLMGNHFHLMLTTPEGNLSQGMLYLEREISKRLNESSGRMNQNFGGRYFRCLIPNYHYYMHCYKYVYRNPVEARLCQKVEEYPFSTLNGLLGFQRLIIPIVADELIFNQTTEQHLQWMNSTPSTSSRKAVELALRRREFQFVADPKTRQKNPLEINIY